jgi:hypothetical protein
MEEEEAQAVSYRYMLLSDNFILKRFLPSFKRDDQLQPLGFLWYC